MKTVARLKAWFSNENISYYRAAIVLGVSVGSLRNWLIRGIKPHQYNINRLEARLDEIGAKK